MKSDPLDVVGPSTMLGNLLRALLRVLVAYRYTVSVVRTLLSSDSLVVRSTREGL